MSLEKIYIKLLFSVYQVPMYSDKKLDCFESGFKGSRLFIKMKKIFKYYNDSENEKFNLHKFGFK